MKQYQETEYGAFSLENSSFPESVDNRHYRQMLEEVAAGEAEILPYVAPVPTVLTPEEKVANMLQNHEITLQELKTVLGA